MASRKGGLRLQTVFTNEMVDQIFQDPESLATVIPSASDHWKVFLRGEHVVELYPSLILRLNMMVLVVELVQYQLLLMGLFVMMRDGLFDCAS